MRIALIWKNKEKLQTFEQYEVAEKLYPFGSNLHGPKKCIRLGAMYPFGVYPFRFRDCNKYLMVS